MMSLQESRTPLAISLAVIARYSRTELVCLDELGSGANAPWDEPPVRALTSVATAEEPEFALLVGAVPVVAEGVPPCLAGEPGAAAAGAVARASAAAATPSPPCLESACCVFAGTAEELPPPTTATARSTGSATADTAADVNRVRGTRAVGCRHALEVLADG